MRPDLADERIALRPREAARLVGCRPEAIREAIRRGELPARRIGRGFVIGRAALERWLLAGDGRS